MRCKKFSCFGVFLIICCFCSIVQATVLSHPAQKQLRNNVNTVLAIARQPQLSEAQKIQKIDNYAEQYLDFNRLSVLAVGLPWRQFSQQQKQDFIVAFKGMVVNMYAHSALMGAAGARVTVLPKMIDHARGRVDTFTEIRTKAGKTFEVTYQMYRVKSVYKIYNIKVDGLSLVTIYRNQFNELINNQGIDGVIQALRNKQFKKVELN